ncbi:MAG: amylo-alpha-1,6-glucosidase [Verrucomicrobiota bacterium]
MEQTIPTMTPAPGERLLRFVGDRLRFTLRDGGPPRSPAGANDPRQRGRGLLRTNLGRGAARRREIIAAHAGGPGHAGASWHDVPMQKNGGVWEIELPLAEAGFFKAKPYWLDAKGWQHWPEGPDIGISVHPNFCRTANAIYCAFARLFGATRTATVAVDAQLNFQLSPLDSQGYTIIPPSGKLRDLTRQLPHIVQTLGCRILHLLPVHPTPTTYARFGRFGSPYAALDLTAIDPALAEFDHRTTGIDQFCELTAAAHALGARIFLDIVINHTGWGAVLQENHPEFFLRNPDGTFASPGAWGITWGDLVELKQEDVVLWDMVADALSTWCRRGVDGFRCDAGYKIPLPAWQYIIARVQDEFPETIFLLEGLGGSWEATENLLTEGGMQWAYSELFQNYSGPEVAHYLDYALRQSAGIGLYVHYSETHDNDRLARRGRAWSLLRNCLCALTSVSGGFGFTCGVEWLAAEKIRVHDCTGLGWDSSDNIIPELAQLNQLLANHPCFFDGAKLTRLSPDDSAVYALLRESADGKDPVLVLVNTDVEQEHPLTLSGFNFQFELLGQPLPKMAVADDKTTFSLAAGACHCLAPARVPQGLGGDAYRLARAQAAWAVEALSQVVPVEMIDNTDWRSLAGQVERSPKNFLAAAAEFAARGAKTPLSQLLSESEAGQIFPRVVVWTLPDHRRITLVPPDHWLLIEDATPFRATLEIPGQADARRARHVQSIAVGNRHVTCFPPRKHAAEAELVLERYAAISQKVSAAIRYLPTTPKFEIRNLKPGNLVLLTNGIGGMARICTDLGRVNSKYDCGLGANLNPTVPVDRHVFVKRIRAWVATDGFLSPLDAKNLSSFTPGPPAVWQFVANAGDGRTVEIELRAEMLAGENTTVFHFSRPTAEHASGKQLPADADVRLTVRFDIEDRNFHWETKRNDGADYHFSTNTRALPAPGPGSQDPACGFAFTPAPERQLRVLANTGEYHPQPEWCENIPHPVEQSRGQTGSGDAYSPGWFELPLPKGASAALVATAEKDAPTHPLPVSQHEEWTNGRVPENHFEQQLLRAARQFVVRRDEGKTVIAGYPWFLDWGRDTLICARGLLAAGRVEEVRQILLTFAKFEKDGTLPNAIYGDNASNRDTTDAPLWFALACEEMAQIKPDFQSETVGSPTRAIREILESIAVNYAKGTSNGIHLDPDSALIWSPGHFTWMDTNHPAGTPREGYPVEIQSLWIRLLRQLERNTQGDGGEKWRKLAERATASLEKLFWLENQGWFADVLLAGPRVIARDATPSDALRSNGLFPVSLGLVTGERAKRCVEAVQKYLVVPGALRSLAPLPVAVPLPIYDNNGRLLNNPPEPYWPSYEGDEDTRRKPAYHNGTAWTWTFPHFCEALARAWGFAPEAVAAARAYLGSVEKLMSEGCLGQIPEILDGDSPHTQRGCDAQAWGVTETLRVWKLLNQRGG